MKKLISNHVSTIRLGVRLRLGNLTTETSRAMKCLLIQFKLESYEIFNRCQNPAETRLLLLSFPAPEFVATNHVSELPITFLECTALAELRRDFFVVYLARHRSSTFIQSSQINVDFFPS